MNKKITFADKESSLKINSQYVLSAPEINEIKKVINNISNEIDIKLKSSDFFKYLSIYIPQNIQNNSDLLIIFGNNETFTNSIEIKLSTHSSRFLYFDNISGTYKSFNKTSINSNDAGKLLLFKLENLIPPNYFYVKYNFENQDNKILSYYNIDKQNQKIDEIEINYFSHKPIQKIFKVSLNKDVAYFFNVTHNWYFDWVNCSGYLTIGNNNWGNYYLEDFISRQEQNFIGWVSDRNNSKQIYYDTRAFFMGM